MVSSVTHVAYSDETSYNTGRFRGVAAVSASVKAATEAEEEIARLLAESNVSELAWKSLRTAKHRFAAEKVCQYVTSRARSGRLRVNALLWDTWDPRHAVEGRNDLANLGRMYHHLFADLLVQRWPDGARWHLYPDEHSGLDWASMEYFLRGRSVRGRRIEGQLFRNLSRAFILNGLTPLTSGDAPLIQVADLLVGLAVFSRTDYKGFSRWHSGHFGQPSLLSSEEDVEDPSNSQEVRFRVLDCFNSSCKDLKLGVSLETWTCLRTPNPENPINFWWWESQGPYDKAPTGSRA